MVCGGTMSVMATEDVRPSTTEGGTASAFPSVPVGTGADAIGGGVTAGGDDCGAESQPLRQTDSQHAKHATIGQWPDRFRTALECAVVNDVFIT